MADDKTFYEERIHRITRELQRGYQGKVCFTEYIREGIAADLYEVFHRAAVRCLIVELHVCKNEGLLSGKTDREEYDSYCGLLTDRRYIDSIYRKYPGLCKYLDELEVTQVSFWREMLERLSDDWQQVVEYFHFDAGTRILSVRRSGSDFHGNGKSVVIIETDRKKKILYKPHTLANEIFLQDLLEEIYGDLGLGTFRYLELERNGYGWVEEVTWEACENRDEVKAFYIRAGVLAAAAYILGIGDLHYENIIAHGEFPVIVDVETLFQHMDPLYEWTEKTTDFYSVLSSGLFPGGSADRNTAGITGGNDSLSAKKMPVILCDKTSGICVAYRQVQMPAGKNYVRCRGKKSNWKDYEREVESGLRMAYTWFCGHKEDVIKRVTDLKDKLKSRYVSGGTQHFGLSLFASVHPEVMQSRSGRKEYLQRIYKDRKLGKQESEAVLRGDIPSFFRKLTDRNLYDERGIQSCDYFEHTIEEQIYNRLRRLSLEDCELQKRVIKIAAGWLGHGPVKERIGEEIAGDPDDGSFDGVGCAKQIAACILENAVRQRGKLYWLGAEEEKERVRVRPVDIYFYGGIAGIAVFFRKLHQDCGVYGDTCEELEEELFSYTDRVYRKEIPPATGYPGMYCGEGSIVYAYQLLYQITGIKKYLEYAGKHAEILIRCVKPDSEFDLLYGNAGAVLVLCRQYVETKEQIYLTEALKALEYLDHSCIESAQGITWFKQAEGNPVCSMAHGNSGVLLAYAGMYAIVHEDALWKKMHKIMAYEDQYYQKEYENWADFRKERDQWETYAWCNGGVGVIYARYLAEMWNPGKFSYFNINDRVRRLCGKMKMKEEMCLCHGNMGNLLVVQKITEGMDGKMAEWKNEFSRKVKKILEAYCLNLKDTGKKELTGLMNGLAGVGMGCLILSNNESCRSQG